MRRGFIMSKSASAPTELELVNFKCDDPCCKKTFKKAPDVVEDFPDRPQHPYRYFALCPKCGNERAPQIAWEQNMLLMAAGLDKHADRIREVRQANIAQVNANRAPLTEEQKYRVKFNALKTGAYASTARWFPARPGRYGECYTCEFNESDDARESCRANVACVKKAELFMQFQVAAETGDPKLLTQLNANTQAGLHVIIQNMVRDILARGTTITSPRFMQDKEGLTHLATFYDHVSGEQRVIEEVEANPLLHHLITFLQKNGMTLTDMALTMKQSDDQDELSGFLDDAEGEGLLDFQRRSLGQLEGMKDLIRRAQAEREQDPVLLEYQAKVGADKSES